MTVLGAVAPLAILLFPGPKGQMAHLALSLSVWSDQFGGIRRVRAPKSTGLYRQSRTSTEKYSGNPTEAESQSLLPHV